MSIKDGLLADFDHEMGTTRKLLERLPEEFLALPGLPSQRALLIVYRRWTAYPEEEQARLATELQRLLEPLLHSKSPEIPTSLREACETVVRT